MIFLEEISVTKIKSASRDKTEYASHIPADRLIHIMEVGRNLSQVEWEVFTEYLDGRRIEYIAKSQGISIPTVYKLFSKINDLLKIAVGNV